MGLLRDRGPYRPRQQHVGIDWAAVMAEKDAIRAAIAAEEERALRSIQKANSPLMNNPLNTLTERCYAIEERHSELLNVVTRLEGQVDVVLAAVRGRETNDGR